MTIAGIDGQLVHEEPFGAVWEAEVAPSSLAQLLSACSSGDALRVTAEGREFSAQARRWLVAPGHESFRVRVLLDDRVTA